MTNVERINDMNEEYTYDEESSLSADRDMFDKCCISCSADDAFYDIDLIPEAEFERIVSVNPTIS